MKAGRTVAASPGSQPMQWPSEAVLIVTEGHGVAWYGTRAQIEAELVIPATVQWRRGAGLQRWFSGGFEWSLLSWRYLPDGRTPVSSTPEDAWRVHRRRVEAPYDGDLLCARRTLAHVERQRSAAGEAERQQWLVAHYEPTFQAFLARAGFPPPGPNQQPEPTP